MSSSQQRHPLQRSWVLVFLTLGVATVSSAQDPGRAGMRQDLQRVAERLDDAVAEGRVPAAVAMIARHGEIMWTHTAGNMGPDRPMRTDVIVPLASAGKMYTATAAMILLDRGVIRLDDPVHQYIPEFANVRVPMNGDDRSPRLVPADRPITIFHLLTHTSGLTVSGDAFWRVWDEHAERTTTTAMARGLAALPLHSHPGTTYRYGQTGAAYEALASVIEIASGQTLEEVLIENVFDPLGLRDTHLYVPPEKTHRSPARWRRRDGTLELVKAYGTDIQRSTYLYGGGGVSTSLPDLARFARIFIDDGTVDGVRVLSQESVRMMLTDQLGSLSPFQRGISWGFGATVRYEEVNGNTITDYYGWAGGGYARFWVNPTNGVTSFAYIALTPPGDSAFLRELEQLVMEALEGHNLN